MISPGSMGALLDVLYWFLSFDGVMTYELGRIIPNSDPDPDLVRLNTNSFLGLDLNSVDLES